MTTLIERIIENEIEIYIFMLIMNPLKLEENQLYLD